MGDDELVEIDERETSVIRKARKKMDQWKLIERIVPPLIAAILGASGGIATHKVEDAGHDAIVEDSSEKIKKLEAQLELLRAGFSQRVEVEENEREEDIEKLRDRVLYLEARTGLRTEPPANAPE